MTHKSLGRRNFVRTAGVALTTSLFPAHLKEVNKRPAGAFIGVGMMGTENLKVALEQGVEVKAVCDVYRPHRERAATLVGRAGQKATQVHDFREILTDQSI